VVALVESPAFQETPSSKQKVQDLALQARARAALRADERTAGVDVVVRAEAGRLTLRGIVLNEEERSLAKALVSALPGVRGVDDELRTMSGGLYRFPSQLKNFPG
jgi:osmotically-inducible protein OsmY